MSEFDVITFGESLGSIRSSGLIRLGGAMSMSIAGAESNVAIGLARLGHSVRWCSRLGADDVGELVRRTLRAEGVDVRAAPFDSDRPTAVMLVEKRVGDISRVSYYRANSAAAALGVGDLEGMFGASARILHVSGITPALSASAREATLWAVGAARDLGIDISFDVNYRSALWSRAEAATVLADIARNAHIVFASDDELSLLAPGDPATAASSLRARGVADVVVKRGGDGATSWTASGETTVPARDVLVVDTIGAGDAFNAGYLSAFLGGDDAHGRLDRGAILGAFAVSARGDWEALPTSAELALLDHSSGTTIR